MNEKSYVYERDYRNLQKMVYATQQLQENNKIFDVIQKTGVLKSVAEKLDCLPKVVDEEKKKDFESLIERLDVFAKKNQGKIRGVICPQDAEARITLELPFFELRDKEELILLEELADKSDYMIISAIDNGWTHILVMIKYFQILASPEEMDDLMEAEFENFPSLLEALENWEDVRRKNLYHTFLYLQTLSDILRAAEEKSGANPEVLFQRFVGRMEKEPEGQDDFLADLCKEFDLEMPKISGTPFAGNVDR